MDLELDAFIKSEFSTPGPSAHGGQAGSGTPGKDSINIVNAPAEYLISLMRLFDAASIAASSAPPEKAAGKLMKVAAMARCMFALKLGPSLENSLIGTKADTCGASRAFAAFLRKRLETRCGVDVSSWPGLADLLEPDRDVLQEMRDSIAKEYNERVARHNAAAELMGGRKLDPITPDEVTDRDVIQRLFPFAEPKRGTLICNFSELESYMRSVLCLTRIGSTSTRHAQMAVFNGSAYSTGPDAVATAAQRLFKLCGMTVTPKAVNDFIGGRVTEMLHQMPSPDLICVGNGIIDVGRGFDPGRPPAPPSPFHYGILMSPVDYVPDAESRYPDAARAADDAFKAWADGDPQLESILYEIIGYALYYGQKFKMSFFLRGAPHCGKTSFLDVLAAMAGGDNCARLTLGQATQHFMTYKLLGRTLCIGDESEAVNFDENKAAADVFKKMTSPGGGMTADVKFTAPVEFDCAAKFVSGSNYLPESSDPAVWQRIMVVPFRHVFPVGRGDDEKPNRGQELAARPDVLQVILVRAVRHLHAMLERSARRLPPFTPCKACEDAKRLHLDCTDPVRGWISATLDGDESIANKAWHFYGNGNIRDSVQWQYARCSEWNKSQPGGHELKMPMKEFFGRVCNALPGQFEEEYGTCRKKFPDAPEELRGRQLYFFKKKGAGRGRPAAAQARAPSADALPAGVIRDPRKGMALDFDSAISCD